MYPRQGHRFTHRTSGYENIGCRPALSRQPILSPPLKVIAACDDHVYGELLVSGWRTTSLCTDTNLLTYPQFRGIGGPSVYQKGALPQCYVRTDASKTKLSQYIENHVPSILVMRLHRCGMDHPFRSVPGEKFGTFA